MALILWLSSIIQYTPLDRLTSFQGKKLPAEDGWERLGLWANQMAFLLAVGSGRLV